MNRFLSEHPFFSSLLERERQILSSYLELYRFPRNAHLTLPNELQEVLWIVVRGRFAELNPKRVKENAKQAAELQNQSYMAAHPEMSFPVFGSEPVSDAAFTVKNTAAGGSALGDRANSNEFPDQSSGESPSTSQAQNVSEPQDIPSPQDSQQQIIRYYLPGDIVNPNALTKEIVSSTEIICLEENTQAICLSAFHLAKLSQQQPKIYRALKPAYNEQNQLVAGLPLQIWHQMGETQPPHTLKSARDWQRSQVVLRSHSSWVSCILVHAALSITYLLQYLAFKSPALNWTLGILFAFLAGFAAIQRYRKEYTLKKSLLHITEKNVLGLRSKMLSYPLLSLSSVDLMRIPLITQAMQIGGLKVRTLQGESITMYPLDQVVLWHTKLKEHLDVARKLHAQQIDRRTISYFERWNKLQPELIKEIDYQSNLAEAKLEQRQSILWLQCSPLLLLLAVGLYFSVSSPLVGVYLTVPLIF